MSFSIMQNVPQSLIQGSSIYYFGFSRPFFHQHILPFEFQIVPNLYPSLASFNFAIRKKVRLSVTVISVPLNFLIFMKTFFLVSYLVNLIIIARFLVLYLVNLVIIARPFLRALFLLPIRCVRSISDSWISSPRCSLIMLINKVSVSYFSSSSTPCIRRQFCLEYCFCFPPCSERLLTLSVNSVTCV